MVERECDREVKVNFPLVVQRTVTRKRVIRGRERWTVRNSCFTVVIWPPLVGFWDSYSE